MPVLSKVAIPFTPVRRFFRAGADVFKHSSTTALGKRRRVDSDDIDAPPPDTTTSTTTSTHPPPNLVALQNDDTDEDAVVITALTVLPFCCHADLLTMSRDELVGVAETLNRKLPEALRIDTGAGRTEGFIRNSVEVLVGITGPERRRYGLDVPAAPVKANRSVEGRTTTTPGTPKKAAVRGRDEDDLELDLHPGASESPLANKSLSNRLNSFNFAALSPPLGVLNEDEGENDYDEEEEGRKRVRRQPLRKKRKVVQDSGLLLLGTTTTPTNTTTPNPRATAGLARSLSERTPRSDINSPFSESVHSGPGLLTRTQSQKVTTTTTRSGFAVAGTSPIRNVTLTRGRGRGPYTKKKRFSYPPVAAGTTTVTMTTGAFSDSLGTHILTSTPKKRKRTPSDSPSFGVGSTTKSGGSGPGSGSSTLRGPNEPSERWTSITFPARRVVETEELEVTAGLEGMSMADEGSGSGSGSDMDISFD